MWELCLRFFSSIFSFWEIKGYYYWQFKFQRLCRRNPASRLLQISRKLKNWQWRHNCLTWPHSQIFLTFFYLSSLVKFSYCSKFRVNIITEFGGMTFFFYKALTRNPEIWRLRQVRNTKFGTEVSNKILLNAKKFECCSHCSFWVNKGKPAEGGGVWERAMGKEKIKLIGVLSKCLKPETSP